MKDIIKDLNELKAEIDESKRKIAQLEGRKEEIINRLKNEYGLHTTIEAHKKIEKEFIRLEKLKTEIEEKYKELKKQFEWGK